MHLLALCAWEFAVVGTLVVMLLVMRPERSLSKNDLLFLGIIAACGLLITGAIGFFTRGRRRVWGVATGIFCGLAPSILLSGYAVILRPGFEASAGAAGMAMTLAVPSALGRAIAGLISSWPMNKTERCGKGRSSPPQAFPPDCVLSVMGTFHQLRGSGSAFRF